MQIEQLVYKLYGLMPEEIEIVESKNGFRNKTHRKSKN